jgi:hypothetical protein
MRRQKRIHRPLDVFRLFFRRYRLAAAARGAEDELTMNERDELV